MTTRSVPSKNALTCGSGLAALLLTAWCAPTIAATGVDIECPESEREQKLALTDVEIPELVIPALKIDVVDHGVDSDASIDDEIVDPPLTSQAVSSSESSDDTATDIDDADVAPEESAPTATRLPGVSDTDQPRYRRQMYRTDI